MPVGVVADERVGDKGLFHVEITHRYSVDKATHINRPAVYHWPKEPGESPSQWNIETVVTGRSFHVLLG